MLRSHCRRAGAFVLPFVLCASLVPHLHAQELESAYETRRFSLPCLRAPVNPIELKLVPYPRLGGEDYEVERERLPGFTVEEFQELAERVLPEGPWNVSGAELRLDAEGRVIARGNRAALDELGRLIGYLSEALLAEQLVDVELYPLRATDVHLALPGAVLESAAVERLLAEAEAQELLGAPQRWTLHARAARFASAGGLREQSFVRDLDVEMAQSGVLADPWCSVVSLGTAVHLRVDARRDGLGLHLLCERHEELGASGERELHSYREFFSERSVLQRDLFAMPARQPALGFATLALSIVLPAGRELLCVQQARGPQGAIGQVLRVRGRGASRTSARFETSQGVLALRDLSALIARRFVRSGPLREGLLSNNSRHGLEICSRLVGEPDLEVGSLLEDLVESCGAGELELACHGALLFLIGEPAPVERGLRWLDEQEALASSTCELHLELRDRSGARSLAELSLALRQESDAYFSMGADELGIVDYDLEVLHSVAIYDPVVEGLGHGMLGRLRTTPLGERVVLELELLLNWMSAATQRISIPSMKGAELDLGAGVRRHLQETYVLARGESASSGDLDPAGPLGLVLHVARRG
ncbi:MAG: hypothetical protein IPN34_26530 [Planctomycetes bacterium]|nr:hypothetical protein [Planctomycetota bacterium]